MPRTEAQTAWPLTFSVPGGSCTNRTGPAPRIWMVPATERSLLDAAGAAGAVEAVVGEGLADDETARSIDTKRLRQRRPSHKQGRCDRHNTHEHLEVPLTRTHTTAFTRG